MLEDMNQLQHLKEKLIQRLQLFSLDHGQYPGHNLIVNIEQLALLPLLKGQNAATQPNPSLLPRIYWQNKERTKTFASFGVIERLNHIPEATNEDFYLGGLAFQQQGEQWTDFPAILFIRPLMVFQQLEQQSQVIFHFNGSNSIQQSIDTLQSLKAHNL